MPLIACAVYYKICFLPEVKKKIFIIQTLTLMQAEREGSKCNDLRVRALKHLINLFDKRIFIK